MSGVPPVASAQDGRQAAHPFQGYGLNHAFPPDHPDGTRYEGSKHARADGDGDNTLVAHQTVVLGVEPPFVDFFDISVKGYP